MISIYFSNNKNANRLQNTQNKRNVEWVPPRSPYNLIQEILYHDPWKLLLSTMFLNKSSGKLAIPVFWEFIQRWNCPEDVLHEDIEKIEKLIEKLGFQRKRAIMFKKFSEDYLSKSWKYPIELHGIGKYGNDSYRIFCINEWRDVKPRDSKLMLYHNWLLQNEHLLLLSES